MVKTETGLERMFRQQEEYDAVCQKAAAFKGDDDEHTRALEKGLQELFGEPLGLEWVEQAPGEFVSRLLMKGKAHG